MRGIGARGFWVLALTVAARGAAAGVVDPFAYLLCPPPTAPLRVAGRASRPLAAPAQKGLTVDPAGREESRLFFQSFFLAPTVVARWNGSHSSCIPGDTAAAFRDSVLLRINYFRAMSGVPAGVTLDDAYNAGSQAAALMCSRNSQLNHHPPASWKCYSDSGADGAANSNLALTYTGRNAVDAYMWDFGPGNYFLGHRRYLLYPQTQQMGTGDVPATNGYLAANAIRVIDSNYWGERPAARDGFVAWPPPGFVPHPVVYPRWSFSYPDADFAGATVTMTSGGTNVPVRIETPLQGYAENTLVWIPLGLSDWDRWPAPKSDTAYEVRIAGVVAGGSGTREFLYRVAVFDPSTPQRSLLPDAIDLGNGWRDSKWFGRYTEIAFPWLCHESHGWLYSAVTSPADIWFWNPGLGWLWTGEAAYPFLYGADLGSWLWYYQGSSAPRYFYSFAEGRWLSL